MLVNDRMYTRHFVRYGPPLWGIARIYGEGSAECAPAWVLTVLLELWDIGYANKRKKRWIMMTLCRNSMVPLLEENKPRKVSHKEVPLFLLCDQGAWHCIGQLKSSVRANKTNSKNSHRTLLSCLPAIANTSAVMASLLTIKPKSVIRDLIPHNLITITISLRYVVALTLPSYAWLTLLQCNTNRNLIDICGQNHLELPNTTSGSSTQIDKLGTMCNIHKGHTRPH